MFMKAYKDKVPLHKNHVDKRPITESMCIKVYKNKIPLYKISGNKSAKANTHGPKAHKYK